MHGQRDVTVVSNRESGSQARVLALKAQPLRSLVWPRLLTCAKLELILTRSCVALHTCEFTRRLHASCCQVDWPSNATLHRSKAGSRLTQALGLSRMPHANDLTAALTKHQDFEGTPPQKQRHGSIAATCIPPTPETAALGYRVEHLSATQDGGLVSIVCRQLHLPEVGAYQQ